MLHKRTRIASAVGLFFLAPLVAEFLLGNLPIKMLPALIVLAPMYGCGALLIREVVRRTGRGWPSILLLALAYGIIEEAFTTQSLFNPNYLSLNLHLLDPGYIPALGVGAWWTLFVLTLHTAWSISTSVALIEALAPASSETPWLGRVGLTLTAVLFIVGAMASAVFGYRQDHYLAAPTQLVGAGLVCLLLIVMAFRLSRRSTVAGRRFPREWVAGVLTLVAGSGVLLVPKGWGWWAAAAVLGLDVLVLAAVWIWSRSPGWNMGHKLALASGAALAYAWHAFIENPAVGHTDSSVRLGNAIFGLGAVGLIAIAAAKNRSTAAPRAQSEQFPA